MKLKPVLPQVDFPAQERELLDFWYQESIVEKYLNRNQISDKKFSFLDGPITANNPMGVHHAWGRTYKDLWQRFFNMKGFRQRFQNGFDEQGLWVEVEVEKQLGLKSKKDIENLVPGDKFKSLEKFINLCKDRVKKYSRIQTEQSKRLGYFMDWDNSYHTSSDQNNFAIWNFLKAVHKNGWLYKGHDSVPWCPRCGTAISQHEILTEDYKQVEHSSVYFKLPVSQKEYLLVWTTTPWTIPANVAVAVDPDEDYVQIKLDQGDLIWVMKKRIENLKKLGVVGEFSEKLVIKGSKLAGLKYEGPFDHLTAVSQSLGDFKHIVVETDKLILPVSSEEGTGLVHVAPGAGTEDFKLGVKLDLPVIEVIDEEANYLKNLDEFASKNAKIHPEIIIDFLKNKDKGRFLLTEQKIKHRYPMCWRCKTELVWRVVDEWYIAMDKSLNGQKTYRKQMIEVAKKINWIPKWGLDRELDWLKNMHDWLISKKRYWGLALPIWECQECGNYEVVGGMKELRDKAVEGWKEFEGHSPHRPWIDQVKIKCSNCGKLSSRIPDVGNPWLDAGIVPFSTMPADWFPADFITEGFPGQFKNWFYSLIAMSTALKNENPFRNLLGFATLLDEKGEEMHKSKGNAIEFNEAADMMGADIMRWMYATQDPEMNLNFGFKLAAEIKRRFYLILWNCYKFFVDYAMLREWKKTDETIGVLDKWILAKLTEVILICNERLVKFDAASASRAIENFVVNDFSTWYIRRSRGKAGPDAKLTERDITLSLMYKILVTLSRLLAPFLPFISEIMYKNLTAGLSVHLTDYPEADKSLSDDKLIADMAHVRKIVELGHAKRKESGIRLRQPLSAVLYRLPERLSKDLEKVLVEELNVKSIGYNKSSKNDPQVELDTKITPKLQAEGEARDLIRQIQQNRKQQNLTLADKTQITAPVWPKEFEKLILSSTASVSIVQGEFKVLKV